MIIVAAAILLTATKQQAEDEIGKKERNTASPSHGEISYI